MGERSQHTSRGHTRRSVLGGIGGLLAAAAFSRPVSGETAARVDDGDASATQTLASPDGSLRVTVDVSDGSPTYRLERDGTTVVGESGLGFDFATQPSFGDGLRVTGSERTSVDESWTPVWDQYDEIDERYEELRIGLEETGAGSPALANTFASPAMNATRITSWTTRTSAAAPPPAPSPCRSIGSNIGSAN